jgi:hypothetical protein
MFVKTFAELQAQSLQELFVVSANHQAAYILKLVREIVINSWKDRSGIRAFTQSEKTRTAPQNSP